jgi:predicted esterase
MKLGGLYNREMRTMVGRDGVSRRELGIWAGGAVTAMLGGACRVASTGSLANDGRIDARPQPKTKTSIAGERALGLGTTRDAILHLPPTVPNTPMPLLVLLHGAGGSGARQLRRLGTAPDEAGVAIVSPDSRSSTWDAIRGDFGADVAFIDKVLEKVFTMVAVDPARLAIGGFSDGATYALSLGLINGDLFPRILALSPGFVVTGAAHGKPRCFVSHGTADDILPIERCSRRIVPVLRQRGHDVTYREFNGGHEAPMPIVTEAMTWLAAK